MATLKKKNRLGTPPTEAEVLNNLTEPEVAPALQSREKSIDRRTLRKTGMTEQFNTRVSKEFLKSLRATAKEEGRTLGKILELSLNSYLLKK